MLFIWYYENEERVLFQKDIDFYNVNNGKTWFNLTEQSIIYDELKKRNIGTGLPILRMSI